MKRFIISAFLMILFVSSAFTQDTTNFRSVINNAFKPGEKLEFEINYGFVTAGSAIMQLEPNTTEINGRKCYVINISVASSSSFEFIYKFRTTYKCYIDAEGIFPWLVEQEKIEGKVNKNSRTEFDHVNLKAIITENEPNKPQTQTEKPIEKYALDDISVFFYARTFDFTNKKAGDIVYFPYFVKDQTKQLGIKFIGRETTEVPAGEFKCMLVQPMLKESALASKVDDIIVWLTDDEYKMPVKIQMSIIIGSVKVELTNFQGLPGPLKTKID